MSWNPALLARVEDASLNASAPPQQRWIDGWLVRFSAGKARRARCVQPVADGRLPLGERLALAQAVYDEAGLPMLIRITPFAQPPALDAELAARGWSAIEETIVMLRRLDGEFATAAASRSAWPATLFWQEVDHDAYAEAVGALRGSTAAECRSHAERLRASPVPYRGACLAIAPDLAGGGSGMTQVAACAQVAREGTFAGLYDVFTAPAWRGQRLATIICERMLSQEYSRGATAAYLQVAADNVPALAMYRRLGFTAAYRYHYRAPPPTPARA